MEVLRSALMNNAENIEEQPALGGLYGSDGFFFQQRRGHLNLRSIAGLNLEKLVREVDVDLLQIHIENITFCNLREEDLRYLTDPQIVKLFRISQLMLEYLLYSQDKLVENLNSYAQKYAEKKKSLSKKRKELAELEESTKLLRNQVKAKKQNIATLEDLLKEANRTREKELRKLKLAKGAEPEVRPAIIRFFIAGPEGLCVEFVQKAETEVAQLLNEARKAFVSKRDHDASYDASMVELRLIFKGKLLMPQQTIEDCEIREGDTIMAMLVERKKPEAPAPAPVVTAPAPVPSGDKEAFTKQMFELMAKQNQEQMRDIVQDINAGWKTALETISANSKPTVIEHPAREGGVDPQLLADMHDKWSRTELQLQEKLHEMQMKQVQSDQEISTLSVLAARRRLRLGDLEDDEDARRSVPAPAAPDNSMFIGRIERVEHQTTYTSLDVERMRAELDALKRQLAERPAPVAPVPVIESPKPQVFKSAPPKDELIHTKSNKWDHLPSVKAASAAAATEVPKDRGTTKAVVFEVETPAPKPVPVPVPEPVREVKPPVKEVKKAPKPTPVPVAAAPEFVDLMFPAQFNPELSMLLGSKEDFRVTVPFRMPLDDVLFEIRKAASTKTRTKFAKVALEYKEKRVVLREDLGEDASEYNAEQIGFLTADGQLRLVFSTRPLTNAQIDMLVPTWEQNKVFLSGGVDAAGRDSTEGTSTKAAAGTKSRLRKRRTWDEDEPAGAAKVMGAGLPTEEDGLPIEPGSLAKGVYRKMRSSLEEALSEISDREGLTDQELKMQTMRLQTVTDTLPQEVSDHIRTYKGAMVGALAVAAAADSGSDTAGPVRSADEVFRASGGSISGKDFSNVRGSRSMSLLPREGAQGPTGGLLRISSSGPNSPGEVSRSSMSVSSTGSRLRRSVEQFDQEENLGGPGMMDDTPMLASVTNSADFRRQAGAFSAAASVAATPVRAGASIGIAQKPTPAPKPSSMLDRNTASGSLSAPLVSSSVQGDSLMYSPAASVAAPNARSRYSAEETEESDLDDSFVERRPQPKAKDESPIKTRWSKPADRSEDDVSFNVTGTSAGDWRGRNDSEDDEPGLRADPKARRGAEGGAGVKMSDSVDSFKREFRAQRGGAGAKSDVSDSNDRFRNTGDTVMSSIPTLNDSVNTFSDQDHESYFRGRGNGLGSTTTTTNGEDMLSTTVDSEGEMLLARGGKYATGGVRASEVGRRADAYERDAARGNSKSNVEHFGDDEGSINSLALSDSNNLDEL